MNANTLWFTARGAGLSAMVLLSLATALGALGSIRMRSASARVITQYLHRTAAALGLSLIVVHVATLILDPKARIGVAATFVPFAAQYRPGAVALGSVAMYLFLLAAALGVARGRIASSSGGAALWRALHVVAYPAWAIAIVHGLTAGTDRSQHWVVLLTIACVVVVVLAILVRAVGMEEPPVGQPSPLAAAGLDRARR